MVWGCMSANRPGNLHFTEDTINLNSYVCTYLASLKQNLKQSVEKWGIEKAFKFYQDYDPKHKIT